LLTKIQVCKTDVENFCEIFNQKRIAYHVVTANCQEFVNAFLMDLTLTTKYTIKNIIKDFSRSSSESLGVSLIEIWKHWFNSGKVLETLSDVLVSFGIENADDLASEIFDGLGNIDVSNFFKWEICFKIVAEILLKYFGKGYFDEFSFDSEEFNILNKSAPLLLRIICPNPVNHASLVLFACCAQILFFCLKKVSNIFLCFNNMTNDMPKY